MKLKLFSCLLILFLLSLGCQEDNIETLPEVNTTEKSVAVYEEGTILTLQIESKYLENNLLGDPSTRNVNIFVPEGYNNDLQKRYPVIYLLHGQPASESSLMYEDPFNVLLAVAGIQTGIDFPQEGFEQWLNNLMETGRMEKALIVMADASNLFGLCYYSNSPTQGNFEPFITKDLVRFIDQHFRTIPNHKARAIVGQCMGGYGALRLAMKYPEVFSNVAALTPLEYTIDGIYFVAQMMLIEEQIFGYSGPTDPYNAYYPFKFMTNAMYGAAAAWLPNPNNPPYYLDLPFSYASNGTPIFNDERMQIFMGEQLLSLIPRYQHNLQKLNSISFDVGLYDELGLTQTSSEIHNLMAELEINHEFEIYEGGHLSQLYTRLEIALVDLSKQITPPYNE